MKIPESWKKVKIKDIAKVSSGGTPSRTKPQYWGGKIPWVKTTQIQNCIITEKDVDEWITEEGLQKSSAKMVPAGTILMAMYGQGKTRGQVSILNLKASINQACAAIELQKEIQRDYIYQFLLANYVQIRNMSNTGSQENLSAGLIKIISILLPPHPERKAIADILSTWDEAIEKSERLIVEKKKRFKTLIQELMYKNCVKWNHLKPSSIFNTVTEKNCPDEKLLSVTQDRGVIPRNMLKGRVMSPAGSTASYKLIKRGDFAISLRSFQGGLEYSNYQGIISPAYTVLRAKIEINNDFYRLFFKSYIFIEKYLNLAVIGIRDGKQISIPDFLNIKIPSPPLSEQKRIAETLIVAQEEIKLLKQLAEKYKEQKQGLMQKLLTGEWRVKV